jgi:DNA-binding YbaB/EbfC family protein
MNLNKLMKQAQQMQAQMAKAQAELEEKSVEVTAVKVTANGAGEILSIKIDKQIVDPNDVEFLEEAVLSGVQQAIEQGKALAQSEMKKITGGLGMPGL